MLHRNLSRKRKGSKNREKARVKLARAYERLETKQTTSYINFQDSTQTTIMLFLWRTYTSRIWSETIGLLKIFLTPLGENFFNCCARNVRYDFMNKWIEVVWINQMFTLFATLVSHS